MVRTKQQAQTIHLIWNAVLMQVVYIIVSQKKRALNGRIKESPWYNKKKTQ